MINFFKELKQDQKIIPLPFPVYFWTVISLSLFGFADSVYLSISHYRVYTDISYRSFCVITRAINCDTVSQSPHSILLGLPVSIWGVIGYTFLLLLMLFARSKRADKKRIWSLLFFISLIYSAYSIVLFAISTFYIKSYCILCIATYAVNLLLLFYIWLIRRRFDQTELISAFKQDFAYLWGIRKQTIAVFSPFLVGIIILQIFLPAYWHMTPAPISGNIPTGITEKGYPWIGAKNPKLIITEFADYQCFQCKKMHFYLRELIAKYPEKIRLVHRHFPMDHRFNPLVKERFHIGAGKMALMAEYAKMRGKFWEMNDLLYKLTDKKFINTRKIGSKIGLNYQGLSLSSSDPVLRYALKHDIAVGIKLGITGTPGFAINGKVYLGQIPPDIIKKAIE